MKRALSWHRQIELFGWVLCFTCLFKALLSQTSDLWFVGKLSISFYFIREERFSSLLILWQNLLSPSSVFSESPGCNVHCLKSRQPSEAASWSGFCTSLSSLYSPLSSLAEEDPSFAFKGRSALLSPTQGHPSWKGPIKAGLPKWKLGMSLKKWSYSVNLSLSLPSRPEASHTPTHTLPQIYFCFHY